MYSDYAPRRGRPAATQNRAKAFFEANPELLSKETLPPSTTDEPITEQHVLPSVTAQPQQSSEKIADDIEQPITPQSSANERPLRPHGLPKPLILELHNTLDVWLIEYLDEYANPKMPIHPKTRDHVIRDFVVKGIQKWLENAEKRQWIKQAIKNAKPSKFPMKWMEKRDRDSNPTGQNPVAEMRERYIHFDDIMNFFWQKTSYLKKCEELCQAAGNVPAGEVHAILDGGFNGIARQISRSVGLAEVTAKNYLRELSDKGVLHRFGSYHDVYLSIGIWNIGAGGSNRQPYVKNNKEWVEVLAGLKLR